MGFLGNLLRGRRAPEPKPRLLAAISYLGIFCLVPLLFNRDQNRFVEHGYPVASGLTTI